MMVKGMNPISQGGVRMRRHMWSLGILLVGSLFLTMVPATLHAEIELKEGMSQGDFALWLVNAVGAMGKMSERYPAATGKDALDFLTSLGVAPEGGWGKSDEALTKEMLCGLMAEADQAGCSGMSFDDVVAKVRDRVEEIFKNFNKKLGFSSLESKFVATSQST